MTPLISLQNLSVSYGRSRALSDVTLDIPAGNIIGVIGPNGAGKSSLIKALCGHLECSGVVKIDGVIMKRAQARQKLIGLVPQDIALYPHLTVRENLSVLANIFGLRKGEQHEAIHHALRSVDMSDRQNTRVSELSGGMKRRVNVAAAIMHNPKLIILDEPTAGVDIPARDALHRLARKLTETGLSVLLITHELEQAEALCDKVIVLSKGQLLAYDSVQNILTRCYQNARQVMVRFTTPPTPDMLSALRPFEFTQGELPNVWTAMTDSDEVSFVQAFMTAVKSNEKSVREITVRHPGLNALIYDIERTGQLP